MMSRTFNSSSLPGAGLQQQHSIVAWIHKLFEFYL
jgi:hypothetical protein